MGQLDGRGGQVINEEAWKWTISRSVKKVRCLVIGVWGENGRDFVFARSFAVFNLVLSNWPVGAGGQPEVKGSHEICTALYLQNCSVRGKLQRLKNGK